MAITGAGAPIGVQQLQAMRLAVGEINAAGGIDGTQLHLVVADTRSDPTNSAVQMRRLVAAGVVAVLGPTLSIEAVRADAVANALHTPVVSVSNTARGIVGRCAQGCDWIWRDSLGADRTVRANVTYFVGQRHPATATLLRAAPDILASSESRVAASAFRAGRVRIVGDVRLPPPGASSPSVGRSVAQALRAHPDVLFVTASDGREAAGAIRVARAQGFRGQILAGDTLNDAGAARVAGQAGAGVRTGAAWFAGNDFPANTDFVRAFRGAFRAQPDQFAAQAYTGIEIVAQAIDRGGARDGGLSVAGRRAAIQKGLGEVALTTPLGPFRFTPDHDVDQVVWILRSTGRGGHDLVQFCDAAC